MRRLAALLPLGLAVVLLSAVSVARENKLPLDFVLEPVLTGLDRPSAMALTADGRIYVAERFSGDVHLVRNGLLVATPVVTVSVATGVDEGLLDLAYDPAGPDTGYLYLYYTESTTGDNVVVRYTLSGDGSRDPWTVINLGPSPGHSRVGGALAVGNDGKLYVGVGDMETSGDAQVNSSNRGKVLRLNPDGTVPLDNPDYPNAWYAKGFRDTPGLASHPGVATLYATDRGPVGGYDELNAVAAGNNHGWPTYNGPAGIGGYTDPLESFTPLIDPSGLTSYTGANLPDADADGYDNDLDGVTDERDETYVDSVFYAAYGTNEIFRSVLTGADLDVRQGQCSVSKSTACSADVDCPGGETCEGPRPLFDPTIEYDPTPDSDTCPPAWADLAKGSDGMLYALSNDPSGSTGGIYRIVYDRIGPREVSPPGSPVLMAMGKSGSDLVMNWENVDRDAWVGTVTGSTQPLERYAIWEGTFASLFGGSYDHAVRLTTDGSPMNDGVLTAQFTPGGSDDRYYLVSAQSANLEGSLGSGAGGERPGKSVQDYCTEIGWFDNDYGDPSREVDCDGSDDDGDGRIDEGCPGKVCGRGFVDGNGQPARLLDQYGNYWSIDDFRGSVIHMDISALDCTNCKRQASGYRDLYDQYKGRGFKTITVLAKNFGSMSPIAPANCAAELQGWIADHAPGADMSVLCGADEDGDNVIDAYEQYGEHIYLYLGSIWSRCTEAPQNLFFDQGMVLYEATCGKWLGRCAGSGLCDGDAAPCSNDYDCVGHGGAEACTNGNNCYGDINCGLCDGDGASCQADADCVGHGGSETCDPVGSEVRCEHWRERETIESKLPPERCE